MGKGVRAKTGKIRLTAAALVGIAGVYLILLALGWISYASYVKPWVLMQSHFGGEMQLSGRTLDGKQVLIAEAKATNDPETRGTTTPLIWLVGSDQIYEIGFTGMEGYIWNQQLNLTDVDRDGREELITGWNLNYGGSGGLLGVAIWKLKDGQLVSFGGLPEEIAGRETEMTVKNMAGKELGRYPLTNFYDVVAYTPRGQLHQAEFIWVTEDELECHLCAHRWKLRGFTLKDGKWQADPKWNGGQAYVMDKEFEPGIPDLYTFLLPDFDRLDQEGGGN